MTIHQEYDQTICDIEAMEDHWHSCGHVTASEMIRHEQLKRWVKAYEQEQRNVPIEDEAI